MPADDAHDPWDSLADSLGAAPAHGDQPPANRPPPAAARKPRQQSRPKPPAAASGTWDDLASELGIAGGGEAAPRPPRPAAPPPRAAEDREAFGERRREPAPVREDRPARRFDDDLPPRRDDAAAERPAVRREDEPRGEDDGERRGGRRRRRGRRGGRGRGRGEAERTGEGGGGEHARSEGDRRPDEFERPPRFRDDAAAAGQRENRPHADADLDEDVAAREPRRESADGGPDSVDDESRPRRRRRRGRRGGRGRSRSDAPREGEVGSEARNTGGGEDDGDEVPTAYGMRPPARSGDGPREGGERPATSRDADDSAAGEGRGRRRRRRRGGESRSRTGAGGESDRGRRRTRDQRQSSRDARSSTLSRGRRDDFAPVAGRHDDDDEGLEFLGIEEAGQDAARRPRAPEDDEILAESGLSSVLEVPSWVEAIGIVIAGNLDARNKGRGGGDRSR